jgi:hypothetical protein
MQNAIPASAEAPMVSLITELAVSTGQNQIRRAAGFFANNVQGQTVNKQTLIMEPGATQTVEDIAALVLASSQTLELTLGYELVASTPLTAVIHAKQLMLDQALQTLQLKNLSSVQAQVTLIYVGPAPLLT